MQIRTAGKSHFLKVDRSHSVCCLFNIRNLIIVNFIIQRLIMCVGQFLDSQLMNIKCDFSHPTEFLSGSLTTS